MTSIMLIMLEPGGEGIALNPTHIHGVRKHEDRITINVGTDREYFVTMPMTLEKFVEWWQESLDDSYGHNRAEFGYTKNQPPLDT